jgi:diacylglycerol kinase family enzyme
LGDSRQYQHRRVGQYPVQYDGEFLGYLPAQIKSTKKTINLLVKEELNVQADQ